MNFAELGEFIWSDLLLGLQGKNELCLRLWDIYSLRSAGELNG